MTESEMFEIKDAVRERDGNRCVDCGMSQDDHVAKRGKRLSVHRLIPGSFYSVDGCVTVCGSCHRRRHAGVERPEVDHHRQSGGVLACRLDEALIDKFRERAQKNRRTLTAEMSLALERHLRETESKRED